MKQDRTESAEDFFQIEIAQFLIFRNQNLCAVKPVQNFIAESLAAGNIIERFERNREIEDRTDIGSGFDPYPAAEQFDVSFRD